MTCGLNPEAAWPPGKRSRPHSWSEVGEPQLVPQGCPVANMYVFLQPTCCFEYFKISCQRLKSEECISGPQRTGFLWKAQMIRCGVSGLCPAGVKLWWPIQAGQAFVGHYSPYWASWLIPGTAWIQWASELASSRCAEQLFWIPEHLVKMLNLIQQVWGQPCVLFWRGSQVMPRLPVLIQSSLWAARLLRSLGLSDFRATLSWSITQSISGCPCFCFLIP